MTFPEFVAAWLSLTAVFAVGFCRLFRWVDTPSAPRPKRRAF